MSHTARFIEEASGRLPGGVYSFNIADFKRRNMTFGHEVGDAEIKVLDGLLAKLGPDAVVVRTHGDRWFVLLPKEDAKQRIRRVRDRFAESTPIQVGWKLRATKEGKTIDAREVVATTIERAVRCLFAHVSTSAELEAAVQRIVEEDYSLPVDRPIALDEISSLERAPWACVALYPAKPTCPFCGASEVDWTDGDMSMFGGSGTCKGCGAELDIRDVAELPKLSHPGFARAWLAAETMARFLAERVKAGDCAKAALHVEATIEGSSDQSASRGAHVFAVKQDGKGDTYGFSGEPDTLSGSFDRRIKASRTKPDRWAMDGFERLVRELPEPTETKELPPFDDLRAVLTEIRRNLDQRVARSPRADALRTTSDVSLRLRWRVYFEVHERTRIERTDIELTASVDHILSATPPRRLHGEELTKADFETGAGARRTFRKLPEPAELDALVAEALVAKPWL